MAGIYIVMSGANIGLGGMKTLGLAGSRNFFEVTQQHAYFIQDSHVRFVGGVWLATGLMFLFTVANLQKFHKVLYILCFQILIGGLARISQDNFSITFGPSIIGPILAEIFGAPILSFWIYKTFKYS